MKSGLRLLKRPKKAQRLLCLFVFAVYKKRSLVIVERPGLLLKNGLKTKKKQASRFIGPPDGDYLVKIA